MERNKCKSDDVLLADLATELRIIEKEALKATLALVMRPIRPKRLPPVPEFGKASLPEASHVGATASCQGFP